MAVRKSIFPKRIAEVDLNKKGVNITSLQVPTPRRRILSDTALLPPAPKKSKVFTRDENQEPRIPLRKRKTHSTRGPLFDIDKNIEKAENKPVCLDKAKISVRKYLTAQPEVAVTTKEDLRAEEVFVDGAQHLLSYNHETSKQNTVVSLYGHAQMSPIKPNVYSSRKTIICQGIPPQLRQPAKKLTLLQKVPRNADRQNPSNGNLDIFNTEYLEDIILYQLRNDWKYVVPKNCGFHITQDYDKNEVRACVVNWIVQAHDYLNLATSTLLIIIRLFDRMFESISIPCNMCQLVILVLLWIVQKYQDNVTVLKISKLLDLCSGVYSKRQFLKMEKKVLQFFSFDLNLPDTTIYVAYYIKKLNIESDLLIQCVHYILECFALNMEFSRDIPSAHAAAATALALQILHPNIKAWKTLEQCIGYYGEEELFPTMDNMLQQLHQVQDPHYKYRQPYIKYSAKERVQASIVLLQKLIAS